MSTAHLELHPALDRARAIPFWLDQPGAPAPLPPLRGREVADLAVVGGGYTGLWTALLAKENGPGRDVVLVEGRKVAWAGSGRNGGFCSASLTHGLANGLARFPAEMPLLHRLGQANLDEIEKTVARYGIDCDFSRAGELSVATAPWQAEALAAAAGSARQVGAELTLLDAEAVQAAVHSPTYLAGLRDQAGCATVDPARLAWGLRRACLEAGVRIYEHTPVTSVTRDGGRLLLGSPQGEVLAERVALGTGAFAPLLRRLGQRLVPVYDYVLTTEPLSAAQLASVGWADRAGVADSGNNFHYYRLTADNRILWGGYDAIYHFGSRIAVGLDQRPATFDLLARHFFATFPQLEGLSFSHAWGGVIDTCTRFCAFYGTAYAGRLAYAAGYTGLGVGATRFGARVLLDLLGGQPTELTELELVRTRPLPFPPEPLRAAGIGLTRWSLARADEQGGRRNRWLQVLDKAGLGFDS